VNARARADRTRWLKGRLAHLRWVPHAWAALPPPGVNTAGGAVRARARRHPIQRRLLSSGRLPRARLHHALALDLRAQGGVCVLALRVCLGAWIPSGCVPRCRTRKQGMGATGGQIDSSTLAALTYAALLQTERTPPPPARPPWAPSSRAAAAWQRPQTRARSLACRLTPCGTPCSSCRHCRGSKWARAA